MARRIDYDNCTFGESTIDSNGNETYVERGKNFEIVGIASDTDTNEIFYDVSCLRLGEKVLFQIPKTDATDIRRLGMYRKFGLDVTDSNRAIVPEVFQQKENEYIKNNKPITNVHSFAGVKKSIDGNGDEIYVYAGYENPVDGSKYVGQFDLKPKGNKDVWFQMVKEELVGHVEIMFVISLPFAAILQGVLRDFIDIDNIIVHLRGDSSSGKTTMLYLAVSAMGNPRENIPNGLVGSWNGTKNALLKRLMGEGENGVCGMLYGLDEFSMYREKDVTSLIYSISTGIERDRLSRDAKIQNRLVGKYLLLSTGEASILNKTNGNIGLAMRLIEFDSNMWTESAEQSERIKKVTKANYGFAAVEFGMLLGKWIQKHGVDALIDEYEHFRQYYLDRCNIKTRSERMSSRYALILLAASLTKKFFGFEMDLEAIVEFLVANEDANAEDRNDYASFYSKLVAVLVSNREHFVRPDGSGMKTKKEMYAQIPSFKECWGKICEVKESVKLNFDGGTYAQEIVYIAIPFFDAIVQKQLGYEDPKALRKFLKKEGLSQCEEGRAYIRKTFDGIRGKYVGVYLPGEVDRGRLEKKKRIEELIKMGTNSRNRRILFEDDSEKEYVTEIVKELDELEPFMNDEQKSKVQVIRKRAIKKGWMKCDNK